MFFGRTSILGVWWLVVKRMIINSAKRSFLYSSFSSNHPGDKSLVEHGIESTTSNDDLCLLFCLILLLCIHLTVGCRHRMWWWWAVPSSPPSSPSSAPSSPVSPLSAPSRYSADRAHTVLASAEFIIDSAAAAAESARMEIVGYRLLTKWI